jgi:signal transduction histidine kinase
MSTTTVPTSQPTVPATRAGASRPPLRQWLRRAPVDLAYLLTSFPLAVASFVLLVTGLAGASSLLGSLLGIPFAALVVVGLLLCARGSAAVERARLGWVGTRITPPLRNAPPARSLFSGAPGFWRRWGTWLRDGQQWLDVLHGLVAFPLSVITFTLSTGWVAGALGGLTYPLWARWLPAQDPSLHDQLGLAVPDAVIRFAAGVLLAVTLVPVLRLCVLAHAGLGRLLLGNEQVRSLEQRVRVLTASRTAAAEAEATSLRSLERDLHDGPQQRLVRLGMDLAAAQRRLDDGDSPAVAALLAAARTQTADALAELRDLSRGFAPPVLADRGLEAALASLAVRCPVHTTVTTAGLPTDGQRLPALVERTAYFVVSEALTNVAKHSGARAATVDAAVADGVLELRVEDDGVGGARVGAGSGLTGLVGRVGAVDGTLEVTSPDGGPTVLTARLPLTEARP